MAEKADSAGNITPAEQDSAAPKPVTAPSAPIVADGAEQRGKEKPGISKPSHPAKTPPMPKATPMMEQYFRIKAENAGYLLFYRMGDFYELFFDDALTASQILGITLTARGRHEGEDIPMCGVPIFAAEDYLQKLIAANCRVAICEQMEDPAEAKKRGYKSVVRREVIRRVTPGTITEEKLLAPARANYLMALARIPGSKAAEGESRRTEHYAIAWADISTGLFRVAATSEKSLLSDILRIEPQELLVPESLFQDNALRPMLDIIGKAAAPQPDSLFEASTAAKRICSYYQVATLDGLADFSKAELKAIAAILAYVEKTQINERPALARPMREDKSQYVFIDAATAVNLELVRTSGGKLEGSLIKAIDRTLTGGGARLLAERLTAPLNHAAQIEERLDSVAFFLSEPQLGEQLRSRLKGMGDIMRALSRLALARGGPRDFATLLRAMETAKEIRHIFALSPLPEELQSAMEELENLPDSLRGKLSAALDDDLPLLKRDGGFVRRGFHAELDELRSLKSETHRVIAAMQAELAAETGIKNLKIKHNNILGYFIETTAAQAAPLTDGAEAKARFIHRQTMANAMRFTTSELADLETRINSAATGALAIELQIFDELTEDVKAAADALRAASEALAALDVSAALAVLAEEQGYCRPVIDDSLELAIVGGRHPVVEQALRAQAADPFIANDCVLSPPAAEVSAAAGSGKKGFAGSIWLLTGPNMGGKSTFLRQNALIVLMAQMGSFVPAGSAHIGLINRLFSRVGASDDLARGRSTFMVEMVETAAILNQADERSLVILDEIGRGTATFDGLSIAWAALEHLHNTNRCRAIFATHFHELTVLADSLPRLSNHTMKVREWHNEVIFLHEVANGAADRSYGVQVAKLAGLPQAVIARAREVLERLENQALTAKTAHILQDLPLFSDWSSHAQTAKRIDNAANAAATPEQQTAANSIPSAMQDSEPNSSAEYPSASVHSQQSKDGHKERSSIPSTFLSAAQQDNTIPAPALTNSASVNIVPALSPSEQKLLAALKALDPDSLSPRAALSELYKLKELLKTKADE